jgi:hypothetical protein
MKCDNCHTHISKEAHLQTIFILINESIKPIEERWNEINRNLTSSKLRKAKLAL